jgi:amino acid transporter
MGAFQGVYLPCVTNILSVVLFLRIALIIGEAGIAQSFVILFFSTTTTLLTVLSMNAIITNGKIRTGGVYYLISRSLGPATGGSIGILYYFAITFSSAMSILGAVETILVISKFTLVSLAFSMRFFSFLLLALLVVIVLFGVRFVSRLGTVIIFLVFISILSMIIGLFASKSRSEEL